MAWKVPRLITKNSWSLQPETAMNLEGDCIIYNTPLVRFNIYIYIYISTKKWANSNISIYRHYKSLMYKTLRPHSSKNVFFNDNQPRHPFLNSSSFRLKSLSLEEKIQLINLKSTQKLSPKKTSSCLKLRLCSQICQLESKYIQKTKVPKYGLYENVIYPW